MFNTDVKPSHSYISLSNIVSLLLFPVGSQALGIFLIMIFFFCWAKGRSCLKSRGCGENEIYFWVCGWRFPSSRKETGRHALGRRQGLGGGGTSRDSGLPGLPASPAGTPWSPRYLVSAEAPGSLLNLGRGSPIPTTVNSYPVEQDGILELDLIKKVK